MSLIQACPKCGGDSGYYKKVVFSGKGVYRYNFDGSAGENGDYIDQIDQKELKTAYCINCDHRLKITE